jgi:hypothetical protein
MMAASGLLALVACADMTRPRPQPGLDLEFTPPTTWLLRVGESRSLGPVSIRFLGVPEDSRCPIDAECPWAGNAVVQLNAEHALGEAPAYPLRLNTGLEPRSAEAYGLRIRLVALRPERRAGIPVDPRDYRAELRLQGIEFDAP